MRDLSFFGAGGGRGVNCWEEIVSVGVWCRESTGVTSQMARSEENLRRHLSLKEAKTAKRKVRKKVEFPAHFYCKLTAQNYTGRANELFYVDDRFIAQIQCILCVINTFNVEPVTSAAIPFSFRENYYFYLFSTNML